MIPNAFFALFSEIDPFKNSLHVKLIIRGFHALESVNVLEPCGAESAEGGNFHFKSFSYALFLDFLKWTKLDT
jgi:hypothetical protein